MADEKGWTTEEWRTFLRTQEEMREDLSARNKPKTDKAQLRAVIAFLEELERKL